MKTTEEIEAKAAELSKSLSNKVSPVVITDNDGAQVVGYFQEPSYKALRYFVDCYGKGDLGLSLEYTLSDCLIKEESDPRILSEERKDAKIKFSFAQACAKLLAPYVDEYKKK